jgi:penicillin-binding protein 1A
MPRIGAERPAGARGTIRRGQRARGAPAMKPGLPGADHLGVMRRATGVLALLLACCLAAAGCVSPRPVALTTPGGSAQSTYLYDASGRLITTLHGPEDRTDVPLGGVSRWLRLAVVDVEDARFYQHGGLDWRALARATLRDLHAGRVVEGGSTITQQYVKNAYASNERSLRRKLREAGLALGVERRNAKDEILAAYLNTVYLGVGAYGVEAAASTYFSTHADRLTLPQAALLAGLVRSPAGYDPFTRPAAALARRAEVLRRMARLHHLQPAQAARAAAAALGLRPSRSRERRHAAPWFVSWVVDQLLDPADRRFAALGATRQARAASLFRGGLRITTTVDLAVQAQAERAARRVVERPGGPYAALAAVEPGTGAVRAMVGGRDYFGDRRFGRVNLATGTGGSGRQAGSAFKAFALVAAIEHGIPPEAVFSAPDQITLARPGGGVYAVRNFEGRGFGQATLREATALSVNTVYAQLLLRLGHGDPDRGGRVVVATAARLGIDPRRLAPQPSAVLGASSVTPLEMAAAYATLASGGVRAAPYGVARVTGMGGHVLYQARPAAKRVLPGSVAAVVDDVLRGVVEHGSGVRARIGRPAAGKTGSTQHNADAWFVGYTPDLAAAVWVGYPQARVPMTPPRTPLTVLGGTWPAAIWASFMEHALAGLPAREFPRPSTELATVTVDVLRDCLPNRFTPAAQIGKVVYLAAVAPQRPCTAPAAPLEGVVPNLAGVPLSTAAAWLAQAGLGMTQRLLVSDAERPGTVLGQSPAGGTAPGRGATVALTVAVDRFGNGGLGMTLVPQVLGQPAEAAMALLRQAGLAGRVTGSCEEDATAAAARPGMVWKAAPGPGGQVAITQPVELWVNPSGCAPAPTTTSTAPRGPAPTTTRP